MTYAVVTAVMLEVDVAVAETVVVGVVTTVVEAGVSRHVQTELTKAPADFKKALSWLARASSRAATAPSRLAAFSAPRAVTISRFAALVTVAVDVIVAVFCHIESALRQPGPAMRAHTVTDKVFVVVVSGVTVAVVVLVTVDVVRL